MRARSKKTARIYRDERIPLVIELLEARPECEAGLLLVRAGISTGCTGRSTEVHEKLSRGRGGDILDPDNCLCLCHMCHRWITMNPKRAEELGFLLPSLPTPHPWEH